MWGAWGDETIALVSVVSVLLVDGALSKEP